MNRYGSMAMRHWQQTDPARFQAIPESEREAFFTELGERAESEILALADAIAGPDRPGESYLEKLGRLNHGAVRRRERDPAGDGPDPDPDDPEIDETQRRIRWRTSSGRSSS